MAAITDFTPDRFSRGMMTAFGSDCVLYPEGSGTGVTLRGVPDREVVEHEGRPAYPRRYQWVFRTPHSANVLAQHDILYVKPTDTYYRLSTPTVDEYGWQMATMAEVSEEEANLG